MTSPIITRKHVTLSAIHEDPKNCRLHSEKNIEAIKHSLATFGQVEPLVVQKSTMKVIGGNGRLAAMKALGWSQCEIAEVDIDDIKAEALGITLNRTAELAQWNDTALAEALTRLIDHDVEVGQYGWSAEDMAWKGVKASTEDAHGTVERIGSLSRMSAVFDRDEDTNYVLMVSFAKREELLEALSLITDGARKTLGNEKRKATIEAFDGELLKRLRTGLA